MNKDEKTQYAVTLLKNKFDGDIFAVGENGSHNIYRYSKPLFLGVDIWMDNIFEYYTLKLTAKSPVFVGSGQSFDKKDFCLLKKTDKIRFMDVDKLIEYLSQSDRNMELFEKFMLEDKTLAKEKVGYRDRRSIVLINKGNK